MSQIFYDFSKFLGKSSSQNLNLLSRDSKKEHIYQKFSFRKNNNNNNNNNILIFGRA